MNKELSQRIIGAIVVTALAAIFIPMLFDEPVQDEAAPIVSQLPIPSGPTGASEEVSQPSPALPTEAGQPESVTETETTQAADDKKILSEDEQAAIESEGEEQEFSANPPEEAGDNETPQLDTGVVDETEPVAEAPPPVKPVQKESVKPVVKPLAKPQQTKPQPPKPVAKPPTTTAKPVITPVVPVTPTKTKPAATANSGGRWYIQAGSFSQKENALALSESLRKQGMPVKLETIQVSGKGTFYRLKVGPELDKSRALSMKSALDQQRIKTLLVAE